MERQRAGPYPPIPLPDAEHLHPPPPRPPPARSDPAPPVHPYPTAPLQRSFRGRAAEHRRQRERRRALYLATLGIDIGPDRIHGVPVTAR